MSGGLEAIIGAAIGVIATTVGVIVQAVLNNRADVRRRQEAQQSALERERRELVQRYLLQLQDAVVSLRQRLENWARRGGQPWAESVDPGYWDITTLYVLGRALAAERVLILEGAYEAIDHQFPSLAKSLRDPTVDNMLRRSLRRLFRYHRLALAESVLDTRTGEYRLLMYTEWRRRYEDPSSGLDQLLEPTMASLQQLEPQRDLEGLIKSLAEFAGHLSSATHIPVE
jgi:hypothetical protein